MSLVETRINVLIVHVNFSYTSSMHRIQTLIKGCTHPLEVDLVFLSYKILLRQHNNGQIFVATILTKKSL